MKTLVLYVYDEFNNRVKYFIDNAIFLDPNVDFMVINNGSDTSITLPDYVIYFKTKNEGYDFGGWSKGLLYNNLYKEYDSFIFVNSFAVGPFVPSYFKGKWTDIYLDGLNDTVKLFGSTINTTNVEESSYVQTYIFTMNNETLLFLISKEIFSINNFSRIYQDNIKMSRDIISNGWNIGCLMTYYKDVDFRFLTTRPSDYKPFLGDPMVSKNFSDKLFNNFYELVFIKGNQFEFNLNNLRIPGLLT